MRPVGVIVIVALLHAGAVSTARADDASGHRGVIDRVALEPSSLGGQRLRIYMSILSLQGQVVDNPEAKSIKLMVGGSRLDAPLGIGMYGATSADTAIVFVVQTSLDFNDVLPVIGEALDQNVLAVAADRTQVAVLPYGETSGSAKLTSAKSARSKATGLSTDGSLGEPLLLDTLERAIGILKKAKTNPEGRPLRKMVVIVGDGRDTSSDRDRVTRIGTRAAKDDIRIHSFGFSPKDVRRPLLLLGELSKRSLGTFRWIRGAKADSWTPAFQQLHAEIARQMVLTFYLPDDEDLSSKTLKIVTTGRAEVTSNEHRIPEVNCAGETCEPGAYCAADQCLTPRQEEGGGVFGWIIRIILILAGGLLVLGIIGFIMTKRQQTRVVLPPGVAPPPSVKRTKVPTAPPPPAISTAPPSIAPPAQPAAAPAGPITGPRFYIMSGPRMGEELAIKHGFTIGKVPGCDLVIDDGYTSSTHAQIGMDHFGNCRLYDRGSTNGSFVNGVKVNAEYPLEHGNTVRIGSTELRFLAQ